MIEIFAAPAQVSFWHKAAEALATQCPELAEEDDISPKKAASRFDPLLTLARFRSAASP